MPFKSKISRGGIRQNVGRTGAGPDGIPMNTLEQNEKNRLRMMHSRAKADQWIIVPYILRRAAHI